MKNTILGLSLFAIFSQALMANEIVVDRKFQILDRKAKSNKPIYKMVELKNLVSSNSFDGKYFKIVEKRSNEAISFDHENKDLVQKAANVYFHLTKANHYWRDVMQSSRQEDLGKMTIRLEITNAFDELGHFANDNKDPQYNNAVSIPAGESPSWVPTAKQDKWNNEIWFRPMKKIRTKDLPKPSGDNPLTSQLRLLEKPVINYVQGQFNVSLMEYLFYPNYVTEPFWQSLVRQAGTIAVTKAIIQGSTYMDNLFIEKYYYLDTAMIPEVIYHEYAHHVLSDHLAMTHSTPVVEGMADYYAAVLTYKKRVYEKVKGHSTANAKDRNSKSFYTHWDESTYKATSDFTLSVLWDVREVLGVEVADQLVFEARKKLETSNATIADSLIRSILETCKTSCPNPRENRLQLFKIFGAKGF
jgi:hypothetical protein